MHLQLLPGGNASLAGCGRDAHGAACTRWTSPNGFVSVKDAGLVSRLLETTGLRCQERCGDDAHWSNGARGEYC